MKKLLFLIPSLSYGGAERVLVNLVNNMDASQFDITLITLFDVGVNKKRLKPHIHYKSFMKRQFCGNSIIIKLIPPRLLYKFFVRDQYDVVISYLEGPTTRIISGCHNIHTKKVAWVHTELGIKEMYSTGFLTVKGAVRAYNNFDKVIFVSENVKETFEQSSKELVKSGKVLYNTNETKWIKEKSCEQITDVEFDSNIVNICSVGKIIHVKGYDRLAKAHKRLLGEGIPHHIYILGVGGKQLEIEEYLESEGIGDSFTFLGFKENPYKYIAACDMYACSSRREGFSTAVTEALILGLPTVSTCCSGAFELLGKNDEYGIVTDNSEEGIYLGLKKMLTEPNLLKFYGQQAYKRGEKFETEKTVIAVEDMINSLF